MKKCIKCGKELENGAEFCNECGSSQKNDIPSEGGTKIVEDVPKSEPRKIVLSEKYSFLRVSSIFSAIIGVIVWCYGFYKYLSYNSGDYGDAVNAYVGGDAYNFIINGTYFTAFSVIGGVFILGAIILCGFYCLITASESR